MSSIKLTALYGAVLVAFCLSPKAQAAYVLNVAQSGGNVVATGTGTINTAALTNAGTATGLATVWPSFPGFSAIVVGTTTGDPVNLWTSVSGPLTFGSGPQIIPNSGSGNKVGLFAGNGLYLPSGYVSGSALSSSTTWNSQTIAGLGLTPGTYTFTWGSGGTADSFVLNIATSAPPTPAPSSLLLVMTGILGVALLQLRRMRRRAVLCRTRD